MGGGEITMNHKINKEYILDGLQERIDKLAREIAEKKRLDLKYTRQSVKKANLRYKLKHGRGRLPNQEEAGATTGSTA